MLKFVKLPIIAAILCLGFLYQLSAQSDRKIVALDFNLKVNGFQFKNYKNEGERWKNDLGNEDLIRMFGAEAMCKKRDRNAKCVEKVDTRPWLEKYLKLMNVGHCEGIAVASLRMKSNLPFKRKSAPSQFQTNATSVYNLQRDEQLENYIAYYWITQTFDEVSIPTKETAEKGPVAIAKMLIEGIRAKSDTFVLRFWKSQNHIPDEGHAVAPFAVEETNTQFIISVYDNNYPGQIRYVYISKNSNQDWRYTSKKTNDYTGNLESQTLELTATSLRDNKCFDPPWAFDSDQRANCGKEASLLKKPVFTNASLISTFQDSDGEDAEFFITGEGNMLITDAGKRLGYDENNQFYDEITNGNFMFVIGGLGIDAPHFTLPYNPNGEDYTIEFSGRNLTEQSVFDFVFSAPGVRGTGGQPDSPGFTVGFNDIFLDPGEILTATVSRDGSLISFTTSGTDTETPEVYYAYDPQNGDKPSYLMTIGGIELNENTTLTYDIDFEAGKLFISDDDGNEDNYDIELTRVNADGTENEYQQNDLNIGQADKYEMDFGDWDGKGDMCFKDDDDGDGFNDEECEEQPNEDVPD